MKKYVFLGILALSHSACNLSQIYSGNIFCLRSQGEYLPIWVRGNTTSGVFIIYLSPGPGSSGMLTYQEFPPFQDLESDYAFVYWDQRNTGSAQGNWDKAPLTMAQFVDDTSEVVGLIKSKYHDPKIVLFGFSWGGALGTAYLINSAREAGISGWIEMNGLHDAVLGFTLSRQYVINYAQGIVNSTSSSASTRQKWQAILDWYSKNPTINKNNIVTHEEYLTEAHGAYPAGASQVQINLIQLLSGPYDLLSERTKDL